MGDVEFVDAIWVERSPGSTIKIRLYTCAVCCALVHEDYMEGHRTWHEN